MPIYEWLTQLWDNWTRGANHTTSRTAGENDEDEVDTINPFPEPVEIEIGDVIDLHTIPPREVKRVIEEYLHEAHGAGFCTVRIIHGKGIGVQRKIVREVLARTAFVVDWTDASSEAGGWGATIVRFSPAGYSTSKTGPQETS